MASRSSRFHFRLCAFASTGRTAPDFLCSSSTQVFVSVGRRARLYIVHSTTVEPRVGSSFLRRSAVTIVRARRPGATGCCGLPGAAVTAAAAPPRPSSGLFNELRLQAGKSTLGILKPLIDANAASFNDVTTGSSSGSCGFHGGWPATKGCDGVTGVGAPNCAELATVVTAPPWMRRARAPLDAPPPRAGGQIVCVWLGMAGGGRCAV